MGSKSRLIINDLPHDFGWLVWFIRETVGRDKSVVISNPSRATDNPRILYLEINLNVLKLNTLDFQRTYDEKTRFFTITSIHEEIT